MRALLISVFFTVFTGFRAAALCPETPPLDVFLTPAEQAELDALVAQTPYPEGTIWQAERDGQSIYLVGTMHLADPRHRATIDALRPVLRRIDSVYLETNSEGTAALQTALASDPSLVFSTAGPTLPELLDDTIWTQLRRQMADRGVPAPLLAKMQPWYVTLMLSAPTCATQGLDTVTGGLDHRIERAARALDRPVLSLEPWESLFTLFATLPQADQIEMLTASVLSDDLTQVTFNGTLDLYFRQQHARAWHLPKVLFDRTPGMSPARQARVLAQAEELLLTRRNRAWMPVILDASRTGPILVAVGAAHLTGTNGLLKALEQNGFSLTSLPL